ncbi:hypothetical protein [Marinifilum fragile]|uniref:hypothetical protein n=1 Tax=Marinifilum fragile TaxID=570161 RepID=UPI002AAC16F4|nr:hypothetical protein [Marinifilum fragile]
MDFSIFYKESFDNGDYSKLDHYDIFLSAFDNCDRTRIVFENVNADIKYWFLFPQNTYVQDGVPTDNVYKSGFFKEDEYFLDFIRMGVISNKLSICIDITGFLRPHLLFLLKYIRILGVQRLDMIYTEPAQYRDGDETKFSGFIDEIRSVEGYTSANINPNSDNDLLIVGAGYDDYLIAKIAQHKSKTKNKYFILGFPSLQPDMYQENILKMGRANESIGEGKHIRYAPAFDPFITAETIKDIVNENPNVTNIYLSPLSTKPHTIGMALYFLWYSDNQPLNIIFPYSNHYATKHAIGVKRTWKYTIELPKKSI